MSSAIENLSIPRREPVGKPLNRLLHENQEQRATEAKQARESHQNARDFRIPASLGAALNRGKVSGQEQEQDKGKDSGSEGKGQLSRPTHESFYQPIPVGGMAPPKTDERSKAIAEAEQKRRRSMGRHI